MFKAVALNIIFCAVAQKGGTSMLLNKEQCDVIMKEAFEGTAIPEYTVDDVNRILLECKPMVQEAVRLKVILGKSSYEASRIMGYNSNYYARDLYNKFLNKVREAPSYSWFNHDKITLDENSSIEYLELSIRSHNCLMRSGIKTIGQLCEYTQSDIKKIRNAGNVVAEEISHKLSLLGFKLKDDPKDSIEGLIPLNTKIQADFSTNVISKMLPVIYNKCVKRTKKYGYKRACISCPYRGIDGADCMFNLQPRIWL